jgi:hypothetical protein
LKIEQNGDPFAAKGFDCILNFGRIFLCDVEVVDAMREANLRRELEVLEVKFKSGSYIQFQLNTYQNKEVFYKKYDAELENMSVEELLNKFSNQ